MAFIQKLPGRDMHLLEGHYGSKLHLRVNPNTQCCDGTYEPVCQDDSDVPSQMPAGEDEQVDRPSSTRSTRSGHAILFGRIKSELGSNDFVLKGEWRHVEGPLEGGSFEMKINDSGLANGWWLKQGESETTPWQWTPRDLEAGLESQPFKKKRQGASDDDEDEDVVQTAIATKPRLRPSLSTRSGRGLSFFDEILESEGASSVRIARWGVLCAWIFFYQTLAALSMSPLQISSPASSLLQCAFQAVYTTTYLSFLVIYSKMRVIPPLDYVMGVALYTLGYACFLTLYAVALAMPDDEDADTPLQLLYLGGSLLFLLGSAMLVRATIPPPVPMLFRELSCMEKIHAQYSLFDQQSSLFWGSITFLLGSFMFCLDSSWSLLNADSRPELLSVFSITLGYAFFTVGRLYFLWGSTTSECDALFRGAGWGYNWCIACLPSKSCCLGLAKRRSKQIAPSVENGLQRPPSIDLQQLSSPKQVIAHDGMLGVLPASSST